MNQTTHRSAQRTGRDADRPAPQEDIHIRIASRVHALRSAQGLSLDGLAARCGVSRSMISLIERGESSATAVLLEKVATGLDVPLASLFDASPAAREPVARRAAQPTWRDPNSGYLRRNVSPAGVASPLQIVEVDFPAGASVSYETAARMTPIHQQVWMLEGAMEVTVGDVRHRLDAGDCLAFALDRPTAFHNPTRRRARYAVVIAAPIVARGFGG
jgi:transcriptional regulator with XRE-family HTH domain